MGIPFLKMAVIGLLPSKLKIAYYRRRGARIGHGVRIGWFSIVEADDIEIGDDCRIGMLSFVNARRVRLGNRVRIGNLVAIDTGSVEIGHDSVVMEQTVVGGMLTPRSKLFVGCRVKIFPYCFLNPTEPIVIEDDVGVGGSTYLFTHGSWQSVLDGFPIGFGPIHLRKGVWLPWRVFILPNVEVGAFSTIGAGAVINRTIPPNSLAAGMPAKVISEDGKYLRPLSSQQRWEKVVEIIEEFAEFLSYQRQPCEIYGDDGKRILKAAASRQCAAFTIEVDQGGERATSAEVFVSLAAISVDERKKLNASSTSWFDIDAGETNLGSHPAVEQVRNFFSRYGVRFAVVTDPPFEPQIDVR